MLPHSLETAKTRNPCPEPAPVSQSITHSSRLPSSILVFEDQKIRFHGPCVHVSPQSPKPRSSGCSWRAFSSKPPALSVHGLVFMLVLRVVEAWLPDLSSRLVPEFRGERDYGLELVSFENMVQGCDMLHLLLIMSLSKSSNNHHVRILPFGKSFVDLPDGCFSKTTPPLLPDLV